MKTTLFATFEHEVITSSHAVHGPSSVSIKAALKPIDVADVMWIGCAPYGAFMMLTPIESADPIIGLEETLDAVLNTGHVY